MNGRYRKVRIREVSIVSSMFALLIALLVAVLVARLRGEFIELHATTEQYIVCVNNARQMQDGSNYLTEQARLYTLWGDREYLDNYFTEKNEIRRVDEAVEKLQKYSGDNDSFTYITTALKLSRVQTEMEYRAMRLMLEAAEEDSAEWPQELLDTVLSEEEVALSWREKLRAAQKLVRSEVYQENKNAIASAITAYRDTMATETRAQQIEADASLSSILWQLEFHTILLLLMILANWGVAYLLLVRPIASYITHVRRGETMPELGGDGAAGARGIL